MPISIKDYDRQYAELINRISQHTTPFPKNIEAQLARKKRAKADKFFFAATYFPHYISLKPEYSDCWKKPDEKYDWIDAGFSEVHKEFFKIADLLGVFSIVAGFRESAKDTLLNHIDVIWKLVHEDRWFIAIVSENETKAEGKSIPIKLEFERNKRLLCDYGDLKGNTKWENGEFTLKTGRGIKTYGRWQSLRGEAIEGHRIDHLIPNDINDPTKPDSPALVQKFVDSVKSDMLYAVNSTRWSGVLLCNYTVKEDIIDRLMTDKYTSHYNKRIFRALIPNNLETKEDRDIARKCREAGEPDNMKSAWEFRHPTLRLLKERRDDPETFETERMMYPRSRKDQRFKDTYFRYHTKSMLTGQKYIYYTFVDPSAKDASDYKSVITVGLGMIHEDTLHIPVVRAYIQQSAIDDMVRETYRHRQTFNSKIVGVETNGFQILLKKEYMRLQKKEGLLPFVEVEHTGESKQSRIERLVPFIKEGTVTFDLDDPDQELLLRQLKAFPNGGVVAQGGVGDDGADALAGCIELIEKFPAIGEFKYHTVQKRAMNFEKGAY